jgi:hypothetical protein
MRQAGRALAVLAAYAVLTAALAWPLVSDLGGKIAGYSTDAYMNRWVDWWSQKALSEGLDIYHTDYLFYPQGTSLVFHSFSHVNTAITLLLTPLAGGLAAYNLTVLLTYVLSGFGMYLLAADLTRCRPAAFVAGLVFAFHPYHMFESAHPVLVTTQWIPLFVLALRRMLRAGKREWVPQALLAALWLSLTVLSSWHLGMMLGGWSVLYLLYRRICSRHSWPSGSLVRLALLATVGTALIGPFLWPIIHEQLTTETAYMAVDVERGRGNDVLSLLVPNQRHPVLAEIASAANERIGFTSKRPGYLGYAALGLAVAAAVALRRETKFWWLTGLLFLFLSLGSQIKWGGVPLNSFHFPWTIPITAVLRHPFRLNVLVFLSLAVLAGFGTSWLLTHSRWRTRPARWLVLALVTVLMMFEYLVVPFPTTDPGHSPFLTLLAKEEGTFAIAVAPTGRQPAKYYMYYQMIHGRRITDGVVSRTPEDAYAFVEGNPLLAALHAVESPDPGLDIEEQFAALAEENVRYLILHKNLFEYEDLGTWVEWIGFLPAPFYADEWLIAYRTEPEVLGPGIGQRIFDVNVRLDDHIQLDGYELSSGEIQPGEPLMITLLWHSDGPLADDYHVFVHLLSTDGALAAQHDSVPAYGTRPVSTWRPSEQIRDEHMLFTDAGLPQGTYELSAGMYDGLTVARVSAFGTDGERLPEDRVLLGTVRVGLVLP